MHFRSSTPCMMILAVLFLIPVSRSDPRATEAGFFCDRTQRPNPNVSFPLFTRVMEVLSQRLDNNGWARSDGSSGNISLYALFQCNRDLSRNDCLQCYAAARTRLPRCLPFLGGRLFLDGCFLRYDRYDFFNESVDSVWDTANCNDSVSVAGRVGPEFGSSVGELVDGVTGDALDNGGYAVRGSRGVFGLAECWNSVGTEGCRACLEKAAREVRGCLPSREGRALNAGCYLRYSTEKFYSNQTQAANGNSGISRKGKAVAISLSVVAFCLFSLFAGYSVYKRWRKRQQERENLGRISSHYNKSKLNFKYETLEKATKYFDDERKLGQGGAGSVYKGTLPDGRTVAVKRLFFSSRQWVDEFFNEVNLISGIEHKNLVKLLGCSIEGPESLLVYEFVPNKSLEQHLFDKKRVKILTWKERYNIILGTAEGLAYLHGGLDFRIIHRDIKSSNVLLDDNYSPKIADFGLARLFAPDKSHLSTGIAGTLGYMAPEYLVKGQLTEKADVYSFGVVILEIVCGRRSNAFEDADSLLQTVWNLYKMDRLMESVDPSLENDFPAMEASRVLTIGLLCSQAYVTQRPSMAEVVKMLTDENYEIPEPNQPPFLSTNSFSGGSTRSSYSTNSSIPHAVVKFGVSYSSTDSSSVQKSEGQSKIEEHRLL